MSRFARLGKVGQRLAPGLKSAGKGLVNVAKKPARLAAGGAGIGAGAAVAGAGIGHGVKKTGAALADTTKATINAVTDPVAELPGELVDKTLSPLDPTGEENAGMGGLVVAGIAVLVVVVLAGGAAGGRRRR